VSPVLDEPAREALPVPGIEIDRRHLVGRLAAHDARLGDDLNVVLGTDEALVELHGVGEVRIEGARHGALRWDQAAASAGSFTALIASAIASKYSARMSSPYTVQMALWPSSAWSVSSRYEKARRSPKI